MIKLKNGAEVPEPEIATVLQKLTSETITLNPVLLHELVTKSHDSHYKMFGNCEVLAAKAGLTTDGKIPTHTKNIILSAVDSTNLLCFVVNSPVAPPLTNRPS